MDYRLALLLQTFNHLRLTPEDLQNILADPAPASEAEVLERLQSESARAHFRKYKDWLADYDRTVSLSERLGITWVHLGHSVYPEGWRRLRSKPVIFSFRGRPVWMDTPLFSVVGSRNPMGDTCLWLQRELPRCLKQVQVGIVSGGARGVDQWAHRLALANRRPTVCILPSGLSDPYPVNQEALWEDILLQDGCMLSTFALEAPMRKSYFPIRNRWIAGLTRLVFIVEANRRSGTQITATCAREEGREICTLPVSPFSAQGLANLDLLEQGATLIRHAEDLSSAISRTVLSGQSLLW